VGDSKNPKCHADLADFRADMAQFREEVRGELATLRTEMYQLHAQTIIWLASLVATGVALTVTLVKVIP
jgi:hypothetical protein